MRKLSMLALPALILSCGQVQQMEEEGAPTTHQIAGHFVLEVDPATKTAVFRADQTVRGLHVGATGYSQGDGAPGAAANTFEAVTNQGTIRGPGDLTCGAGAQNCFEVQIVNNTGTDFTQLLMRIDSTTPAVGYDPYNPDPLPTGAGIGAGMGVFNFGDIPNGTTSMVKDVSMNAASSMPFYVRGTWWVESTGPVLFEDFEAGAPGWTTGVDQGPASDWEIGDPAGFGPGTGYNSTNCAGTVLTGTYTSADAGGHLMWLRTPTMDLTGSANPTLRFWQWHYLEDGGAGAYDGGRLRISWDGGTSFTPITNPALSLPYDGIVDSGYANPIMGEEVWTGDRFNWNEVIVDLSIDLGANPVNQVVIEFQMGTDSSISYDGWYVDDVTVN